MSEEICRKETYPSKAAAEANRRHKFLKIYLCPHCQGFHFTKQEQQGHKRKNENWMTNAERRHILNKLNDLGRQIDRANRRELKRQAASIEDFRRRMAEEAESAKIFAERIADQAENLRIAVRMAERIARA